MIDKAIKVKKPKLSQGYKYKKVVVRVKALPLHGELTADEIRSAIKTVRIRMKVSTKKKPSIQNKADSFRIVSAKPNKAEASARAARKKAC